jgi:hypothetical protein
MYKETREREREREREEGIKYPKDVTKRDRGDQEKTGQNT